MFYSLKGKIIDIGLSSVVIECGGVGFFCQTTTNTLNDLAGKTEANVFTYLSVRENALDLFAFSTIEERDWFKLLIGVSGVGPSKALPILSEMTPPELSRAIVDEDVKAIMRAQGVGSKLASLIILKLKDKAKNAKLSESAKKAVKNTDSQKEAATALTMLGYTKSEATDIVLKLDGQKSTEELIKEALKMLSKG